MTLAAPLVVPERGAVRVQVRVGVVDGVGRRSVVVHSRVEDGVEGPWVLHAAGVLAEGVGAPVGGVFDGSVWPPVGAEPVGLDGFYEARAVEGFAYGPVFQGLRAVWRRGDEVFAEVGLPEGVRGEAGAFGLHPAVLDAGLHAAWFLGGAEDAGGVPFSWGGVTLHASGASVVRVRLVRAGDGAVSVAVADMAGAPVASVESLAMRALSADALGDERALVNDALFRLDWTP
ncbi:polyketide synthase dehydratase domain-containing protein, partial [Streptomyces sp. ISL-111]|uniref:polyketide synthase dehydratase domain-containing protein n=1 Tax=Streptomyces sp. ISL-111 TaxID=2819175 RepID=UPI0020357419